MDFVNYNFEKTISFKEQKAKINPGLFVVSRGKPAQDFSFKDYSGSTVHLSEFKGKYVYIDVWNSACGSCFKEFPYMAELIKK